MKKLKLNIQKFSSTNKTTNLDLSQYTANDKPTYLVDYNGDMLKIDTAVHSNTIKATQNETNIGTMSNLNTTEKGSLVGAINEVNTQVGTNTSNITSLNTQTSANTGNIGTMANLETTDKTSLVSAINEVKETADNIKEFNFTDFSSYTTSQITPSELSISLSSSSLQIATNNSGSIGKIYGTIILTFNGTVSSGAYISLQSNLRPSQNITINNCGMKINYNAPYGPGNLEDIFETSLQVLTTGEVRIYCEPINTGIVAMRILLYPCLYFMKDFGDSIN